MKKALLFTLALGLFLNASAQNFKTAKARTLTWIGKAAYGSYEPRGEIKLESAQMEIDDNTLTALEVVIDMKSLNHDNSRLEKHLKNADFFEVSKYPQARFVLKEAVPLENQTLKVRGMLTVKDKTQFEEFEVAITQLEDEVVLQFKVNVNRTDYGVTYNSPSLFQTMKNDAIDDNFQLKGRVQLFAH